MGQEIPGIATVEQATDITQLLTPDGVKARFAPYISGKVVSERDGSFFGKKSVVAEIEAQLNTTGIAVVEGGHCSGKTSLLQVVGEQMIEQEVVQAAVHYDLQSNYSTPPEEVTSDIEENIRYHSPRKKAKAVTAVISFDEIEAYEPSNQAGLLDVVEQMKANGHRVVISVIGDLHGDSPEELPRPIKNRILEMVGNKVVINRLLEDEEMRQLLAYGDKPLFTEAMTKYLITESGGHPYMANLLAGEVFEQLKFNEIEPSELVRKIKQEMPDKLGHFGAVVDRIIAAGFDPITWEWNGMGQKPDVEVYRNMIPKFTSRIFREWLSGYMARLSRAS